MKYIILYNKIINRTVTNRFGTPDKCTPPQGLPAVHRCTNNSLLERHIHYCAEFMEEIEGIS